MRATNIGRELDFDDLVYVPESCVSKLQRLKAGDIVLAASSGSKSVVGKAAQLKHDWQGSFGAFCMGLRVVSPIHAGYLAWFLQADEYRKQISKLASGSNINNLRRDHINSIPCRIAPLAEQLRIVAKVEDLFSDLDAGVAALERVRANLKRYRAAVLKAAVEGRLTADWRAAHPDAEPASALLARILADRRAKWEADQRAKFAAAGKPPPKNWQAKYAEPSPPDTVNLPPLPPGWCWIALSQVLHRIEAGKSFECLTRRANPDEWGIIKVSAMTWGTFDEKENKAVPPEKAFEQSAEIQRGDILLSRSNTSELVGATVLVGACRPRLLLSDKSMRLVPSACIDRTWLQRVMSSIVARRQMSAVATGTSDSMRNISQEKVEAVALPLPPLAEQAAIVAEVEERLSVAAAAERQVAADLARAARLRQAILKRAFAGRLVPQDPADEPAAKLLERIRSGTRATLRLSIKRNSKPKSVDLHRAALATYPVKRLHQGQHFGRTQLVKVAHLSQCHLGIDWKTTFQRGEFGPFDPGIFAAEDVAERQEWFEVRERESHGFSYHPGPKIEDGYRRAVKTVGKMRGAFDTLLDQIGRMTTDEAEILSTLYAAWNDLLIDGRPADDECIVSEFYSWHEHKKRFSKSAIAQQIEWMRHHGYVPTGQGMRTSTPDPV